MRASSDRFTHAVMFVLIVMFTLSVPTPGSAFLKGDIDDDGAIGIPESIYALRTVAGLTVPQATTTINVPADVGTLQGAIDAAASGEMIVVAAGTYTENLVITKDNLIIQGAGEDTTIIDGGGSGTTITINNARNVVISGLQIINGDLGIRQRFSNVSISNTRIESNNSYGMRAQNSSYLYMENVQVKNNAYGLRVTGNSTADLSAVTISNNSSTGLRVEASSTLYAEGTSISSNAGNGMQVYRTSFAYFMYGSSAEGNGNTGVVVGGTSSMFISDVSISNNGAAGIAIGNASAVDIESFDGANPTQISGNGTAQEWGVGIGINENSTCKIVGGASDIVISNNNGGGINADSGGTLVIRAGPSVGAGPVVITGNGNVNTFGGLGIFRTSKAILQGDGIQISGNTGWGINVDWGTSQAYTDEATIDYDGTNDDDPNSLGAINPQP